MKQNRTVRFQDLGGMAYQQAWDLQAELLKASVEIKNQNRETGEQQETPNHLLFVEHPPVYTLGKSGKIDHLLLSESEMEARGIEFFKINRGGDITYHGPGQIVGYPIFDLENFKADIHLYLRNMEEAVIQLLKQEYGIESGRIPKYTGVWLDIESDNPRKILAIGVRCSRWVTMHGFAFNVNTDLNYFSNIIPCGIEDKGVTSLAHELGREMDMELVKKQLLGHLQEQFQFELQAKTALP